LELEIARPELVILDLVSAGVLIAMVLALNNTLRVTANLRGKPGGYLLGVIAGVIAGFAVAQALSVLNVSLSLFAGDDITNFGVPLRVAQLAVIFIVSVWAWMKMRRLT
jgi:hypothetical protein